MLLELKNLVVNYGTANIIKNISLGIEQGTVACLIGANGAGKSTILKAISGLIPVKKGEIYFNGKRINGLPADKIVSQGIVHVPEGRRLFTHMSVEANLRLGAFLRKDKVSIEDDLEMTFRNFPRLKERANQKAGTLSGGEQTILAISRGLMSRPKLLLLDEPSLGLSPIIIKELGKVIKQVHQNGISVLLVEQNTNLVSDVAEKCFVLEVGQIVMGGNIKELMNDKSVQRAFIGG